MMASNYSINGGSSGSPEGTGLASGNQGPRTTQGEPGGLRLEAAAELLSGLSSNSNSEASSR